jgi:hypothetical protein
VLAVIATYYAVPVDKQGGDLLTGVLFTLVGASVLGWAIAARSGTAGRGRHLPALVTCRAAWSLPALGYSPASRPGQRRT